MEKAPDCAAIVACPDSRQHFSVQEAPEKSPPKPGQPGAVVIPEGTAPEQARQLVEAEMERQKKAAADAKAAEGKKK